ncbi:PREDICTED: dual specificity [Prunus dulcis]|uniref:protein-tyrosine-phosphatase n=2 Tax=Prunus dulcis TaxID=3755 RepID=A0A5E4GB03_PRUDU|nr:PREDICTED: dual specificity [Prunus dulcis]
MPYLVRENLFLGNIRDATEVIRNGSKEITHILCAIPTKEIKVYDAGSVGGSASVGDGSISFRAGKDLKLERMGVPLRDRHDENLLDYLDACVDFIDKGRKKGSVLVHCFAGVSRSASIITAYLMRTEHLSQEDALGSLRQSCEFVCPNDGFLHQLKMYEEMGFKVDRASPIYKSFRLKVLGTVLFFLLHLPLPLNLLFFIEHLEFMLSYFSFSSFGNIRDDESAPWDIESRL